MAIKLGDYHPQECLYFLFASQNDEELGNFITEAWTTLDPSEKLINKLKDFLGDVKKESLSDYSKNITKKNFDDVEISFLKKRKENRSTLDLKFVANDDRIIFKFSKHDLFELKEIQIVNGSAIHYTLEI